ncbi:type IV secretion system protein VirB3 [Anaplasmataceae bacterium AB001_6]|nr:type IV secretion system protein VirB3 [Anaplasmataceae bacterium AB001_6]
MANTGSVHTDPVFKGLTRPAMLFGVGFTFAGMNVVISVASYIMTKELLFLFVLLPVVHSVGYVISFSEPLFLELFIIRSSKCSRCRNKAYHGANSYDIS